MHAMTGIKVLDFSTGVAGPHAGMLCAQHGADVIKIESLEGDWARMLGKRCGDLTANSLIYNQGKQSISLDLKSPPALSIVQDMAASADVIIEAFRPGVMARFGLDYETIRQANPGVIYVSVTGFGSKGPLVQAPATDAVLQGFTGFNHNNKSKDGEPQRLDFFLIDVTCGLYAFQAIATSLLERVRHKSAGKHIDCSLLKSAIALQAGKIIEKTIEDDDGAIYVPLGVFQTLDGHISLSVRKDDHFKSLCESLGRADLVASGRYNTGPQRVTNEKELLPILQAELARRTTAELSKLLTAADVLHSPVYTYKDMLQTEQLQQSGAVNWQVHDGFATKLPVATIPGAPAIPEAQRAPHLGEHSDQLLKSWGISDSLIDELHRIGAVHQFRTEN